MFQEVLVFSISAAMHWGVLSVAPRSVSKSCASCLTETAVDRQISFPLSSVLHANGERNGQPLLHDFTEDIQFMDIEESSGDGRNWDLDGYRGQWSNLVSFKQIYILGLLIVNIYNNK